MSGTHEEFTAEIREKLRTQYGELNVKIAKARNELKELEEDRLEIEKNLFLLTTKYRDNDIVIAGQDMRISGSTKMKCVEKECLLKLCYADSLYGWKFKAFPRRADGAWSERYFWIYDLAKIIRKADENAER
jgi:hypothetical protein